MKLFLAQWETRNFTWQAVGSTESHARELLAMMWADWCSRTEGADPGLLVEEADDIAVLELRTGVMMRDGEPYTFPRVVC